MVVSTFHLPYSAQREHAGPLRELAQEALVEGGDVDVERVVVDGGGGRVVRAQRRDHGAQRVDRQVAHAAALRSGADRIGHGVGQFGLMPGRREQDARAVVQQRDRREAGRRVGQEIPRQAGEHADVGRAVIQDPGGGGAAGGVVAGGVLGLDQRDLVIGGEMGGGGGPGDAGADHHDVEGMGFHGAGASAAAVQHARERWRLRK